MENPKLLVVILFSGTLLLGGSFLFYFYFSRNDSENNYLDHEDATNPSEAYSKVGVTQLDNFTPALNFKKDETSAYKPPDTLSERKSSAKKLEKTLNINSSSVNPVPTVSEVSTNNIRENKNTSVSALGVVSSNSESSTKLENSSFSAHRVVGTNLENSKRPENTSASVVNSVVNLETNRKQKIESSNISSENGFSFNNQVLVLNKPDPIVISEPENKKDDEYLKMIEGHFNEHIRNEPDKVLVEKYEKFFKGEINPSFDKAFGYLCKIMTTYMKTFMQELVTKALVAVPPDVNVLRILSGTPYQFVRKVEELNGKNPFDTSQLRTFEELLAITFNEKFIIAKRSYEPLNLTEKVLQTVYAEYKANEGFIKILEAEFKGFSALVAQEYSNKMYYVLFSPTVKEMIRRAVDKADFRDLIKQAQNWMSKYSINPTLPCHNITLQLNSPLEKVVERFGRIYLPFPCESTTWNFAELTSKNQPRSVVNTGGICYAISFYQCLATFYPLIMKFAIGKHPKTKHLLNILEELNKPGAPSLDLQPYVNLPASGNACEVLRNLVREFAQDLAAIKDFNWHHLAGVTDYSDMPDLTFAPVYQILKGAFSVDKKSTPIALTNKITKGPLLMVNAEDYVGSIPKELKINDMTGAVRRYDLRAMAMGGSGHFASFVYRGNSWYHCDDDTVKSITEPPLDPAQRKAYGRTPNLCFYLLNR